MHCHMLSILTLFFFKMKIGQIITIKKKLIQTRGLTLTLTIGVKYLILQPILLI